MKKTIQPKRPLSLSAETLRALDLAGVAGGHAKNIDTCGSLCESCGYASWVQICSAACN